MSVPGVRETHLAEFAALRSEIAQRSTAQNSFVSLSLTSSGVIFAVIAATAKGVPTPALLVVPLLALSFGLLWIDHSVAIRGIADYIDQVLTPGLTTDVGSDVLQWERSSNLINGRKLPVVLRMAFAAYLVFALPGYVGLGFSVSLLTSGSAVVRWLWIGSFVTQVIFGYTWFRNSRSLR